MEKSAHEIVICAPRRVTDAAAPPCAPADPSKMRSDSRTSLLSPIGNRCRKCRPTKRCACQHTLSFVAGALVGAVAVFAAFANQGSGDIPDDICSGLGELNSGNGTGPATFTITRARSLNQTAEVQYPGSQANLSASIASPTPAPAPLPTCADYSMCETRSSSGGDIVCSKASTLSVRATGFEKTSGRALFWLFLTQQGWNTFARDGKGCPANLCRSVVATVGADLTASAIFHDVPHGNRAFLVLHDENGNSRLNTNWIGMPTEGLAASRGAKGGPFGGPSWSDAKFPVSTVHCNATESVEMWYL